MATLNIPRVLRMLDLVRERIDQDMSVQKLQVLLLCVSRPDGIDQASVLEYTGQSRSAVSKNIADLTDLTSKKRPGPGILRSEPDPMNLVSRNISLTDKGKRLWGEILQDVG